MQSGCPHSQAGAYPAFQHQNGIGAFASPPNNNITPVPVIHPTNGTQKNMVATQYPGELRVACVPGQWQQGNLQLQQNFQGLPQQESQPSTASTEFQHPKPRDSTCSPGNSCYQISRKANTNAVPESKKLRFCSLLYGLLKGNPPDFQSCFTKPSSSSEETNANIELNASTIFSDEMHKSQQVRSPPAALNCGKTRTQNLPHSGGTHATLPQQQICSPYFSNQPSTDKVLPVGETVPPTDDQIKDHITKKVAHFQTILAEQNRNYGHTFSKKGWHFCANTRDSTPQSECIIKSNSVAHFPTTSASDKDVKRQSLSCAVVEQCTPAFGQTLEEDSSRGSRANESTPKSKQMSACATSASKKHSTGTLVSDIRNSKHTPKTESVEKSALVEFELSVKKDFDVTMPANEDVRRVYSGDYENKTFVCSHDEDFYSKWCDKYVQNGVTILRYSLTTLKELIAALENVETIAEMDNFPKVILQQYWNGDIDNIHLFASTEYPQIMGKVAATCTKNEDESPVILTAVSGIASDELTEKHPSSSLNCSSSQEEYKSVWQNINKNLDHTDQMSSVSWGLKHMTEREKGNTSLKPVEAAGLNNVQGVTDVSEDLQTKSSSKLNLLIDKIQVHNVVSIPTNQSECLYNHTICECVKDNVGSVHSQTDVSIANSTKDKEHAPLCKSKGEEALSVNIFKNPQYEDISDGEDMSQLATNLPSTEHKELRISACCEDFQYEDISEDENPQIENVAVERPSLTQVPEPNNKELPFESSGHVQGQAPLKTEIISDEELIPKKVSQEVEALDAAHYSSSCFVETDDGFEGLSCPKCNSRRHLGWQTNRSDSCSPSSVLKDEDETDDQMDDDWLVIPVSLSDLKFEPEDEDSSENVALDDGEIEDDQTQCDTNQVPASSPSQMEVFDTIECFLQAKYVQFKNRSTTEHELDCERKPHPPQNRRETYSEPEDSCDTEDSCEYSSGSEHNYLTVSRQLLKKSATLSPETDDSVSEKEDEDEVANVQKGQTRSLNKSGCMQKLKQLIQAKAASKHVQHNTNGQNISKKDDIIILDSDTEDESDQNGKKKVKRKRFFSSGSDDSGDAPQQQSKLHDTHSKELMYDIRSDLSHSSEKSGQLMETKGGSKHVLHNRQKTSKKEHVIILDSDTEDDIDQNYKKATRKRLYSSASADGGHASCVPQKMHSSESVDSDYESSEVKLRDTRVSSGDSSLLQQQSELHDTHSKELMQDTRSDLSHGSEKSGQLIEAHGGFEHIQHKSNRQMMSEGRRKTKRILPSGSEDTGDAFFSKKNRPSTETVNSLFETTNKKTKNPRLSPEDSSKKPPQSAGKETDSTLNPNPVIPRLVAVKSCQPTEYLKLIKESSVHMQVNDETPAPKTLTGTSEHTDCEKNTRNVHRNKRGRFMSKAKPANGKQHPTKNMVLTSIVKPTLISGQLLLPCQEGPSTSIGSLSSRSGQFSEARQISTSSRGLPQSGEASNSYDLSKPKQSTSTPRHLSSAKMHLARSFSNPSPLDYPGTHTKGPSSFTAMQSSTRNQLTNDWKNSFFPTRRDRKSNLEEDFRTSNYDSRSDTRQGPSHYDRAARQRHNSLKSAAPLMKKIKPVAIELTRARIRDAPRKQRYSVGDGYKWSEKPTVAKPTKGSSR